MLRSVTVCVGVPSNSNSDRKPSITEPLTTGQNVLVGTFYADSSLAALNHPGEGLKRCLWIGNVS